MSRNRRKPKPVQHGPVTLADSVVLLSNMNRSTCGTGFVVGRVGDTAYVYTCNHVVADLGGPEQVWVGHRQAKVAYSGRSDGIDLAVLQVNGLAGAHTLPLAETVEPKSGSRFSLWGYSQLESNSDKYIRQLVTGKLGSSLTMQAQTAEHAVAAWELRIDPKSLPLLGGYSGAPVHIDGTGVVAIASHKFDDGKRGLAISARALQPLWAAQPLWELPTTPSVKEPEEIAEWPETPPEGPNPDDPQKGRWGGSPEAGGLQLSAVLTAVRKSLFYVDLVVSSTDGKPLGGPVRFHLHPSYPRSIITIRKVRPNNTLVLEEVSAYEAYTLGAEVRRPDSSVVPLELDLTTLRYLPRRFR
jgi:hypothetical protein